MAELVVGTCQERREEDWDS